MASTRIQRKRAEQTRDAPGAPDLAVRSELELVPSAGQPLDTGLRATLEPRFGHDFGQVRVHSDPPAAASAAALDAHAFTVGSDVVFGAGEYAPGSPAGQELIAHELAHVIQQQSAPAATPPQARAFAVAPPNDPLEQAADAAAAAVLAEPAAPVSGFDLAPIAQPLVLRKAVAEHDDDEDRRRLQAQLLAMSGDDAPTETTVAKTEAAQVEVVEPEIAEVEIATVEIAATEVAEVGIAEPEIAATEAAAGDLAEPEIVGAGATAMAGAADAAQPAVSPAESGAAGASAAATESPVSIGAASAAPAPAVSGAGAASAGAAPAPAEAGAAGIGAAPEAAATTVPAESLALTGTAGAGAAPETAAAAGGGGAAAPARPEDDPAFQAVVGQVGAAAAGQGAHAPAGQKAGEAAAAAAMPEAERAGRAQHGQVGAIDQAATAQAEAAAGDSVPGFDKEAFKAAIRQRIQQLTPSDPQEMENFGSSDSLDQVRGEVGGQVEGGKQAAQGTVAAAVAAEPDVAAVPEQTPTPLRPNDPGAPPAAPAAAGAAPKPLGPDQLETPLAAESARLDGQLAEAQISEDQLANSNEPQFQAALGLKRDSQAAAASAPAEYRGSEAERLSGAQAEAAATAQVGVEGMAADRGALFDQVDTLQGGAQTGDEAKRAEIGAQVNAIYEETKSAVEARLQKLDADVNTAFESGATAAKRAFGDYVARETAEYKRKRYNEDGGLLDQIGGAATALWDSMTQMPDDYYEIYAAGRELYVAEMDLALDSIADVVGAGLAEAKQLVADGRRRISEFVAGQPAELRGLAEQAAGDIQGRFDELERNVDSRRDQIVQDLAQRYSDNLTALDAEIAATREANKGFLQRAYEATAGVLEQIGRLKDMLLGALGGALDAVMAIISAPIEFIGNLIDGIGQGLNNFVAHIGEHLQTGFIEWLTGTLGGAGIRVPATLDLPGVLDLALQVLGLTWANMRSRAVAIFGEGLVAALETGFELFVILVNEGLPGVWQWIQDQLSGLYDQVIDGIKEMLVGEVIEAGIRWLIGLLGGPAGAFVRACMMIYDIIVWFVNNAQRIASLIQAVGEGARAIANGDLSGAATRVEEALARAVPTAIGFLASLIGLGDLSTKVRKVIERIQEPVNQAIDWLLNMVKGFVQKVARLLGFGEDGQPAADGGLTDPVPFEAEGESHELYTAVQGSQATLMVASTPMTVGERIADWDGRLGSWEARLADWDARLAEGFSEEEQSEATQQIGQARAWMAQSRTLLSGADADGDELAQAQTQVKTLDDGARLAAVEQHYKQTQRELTQVLAQLFVLFKDPPRVFLPGEQVRPTTRYPTADEVPAAYRDDPARFDALAADPAHQDRDGRGTITPKSRREAMAGLEAERLGYVEGQIERGPAAIEFYDGHGLPYDVKTPPSLPPTVRSPFDAESAGLSVLGELRKSPFPRNKPDQNAPDQLEERQVILNSTYLTREDHREVWKYVEDNASEDELRRIIELNTE